MDLLNPEQPSHHVLVKFGKSIPDAAQGEVLLAIEMMLRTRGIEAEVFLETMRDQNVLRRKLTPQDSL